MWAEGNLHTLLSKVVSAVNLLWHDKLGPLGLRRRVNVFCCRNILALARARPVPLDAAVAHADVGAALAEDLRVIV